jgi:PAS domain S-box-containing protein
MAVPMSAAGHSALGSRRARGTEPPDGGTDGAAPDSGLSDPINILIVDDEPINLTVLETVLEDPAYKLVRAESVDQALMALMTNEFALLILDVRMPGMTGFELATLIKQRKKTEQIPIIFLTAYYNEDQHVLEGYSSGAVDYLHKPINATVLRSKVSVFANLYRQTRELERVNRKLNAEVAVRRETQHGLQELNRTLEQRVKTRTNALLERTRVLEAAQEQLRAAATQFQGLADAAPGFIWSTDAQGRFTFMSRRFEVLTGLTLQDLRHDDWQQVLHPDERAAATELFLEAIRNRSPLNGRMRVRRTDGGYCWIESSAVPLLDDSPDAPPNFRGLIGVSMDVSELVEAEQELREADQRKDEFLATLAHELRNPLAPIRHAVQIMRTKGIVEPAVANLRDIIDRQVSSMARMVDDLLDVSRISRGKLELRKSRVTLQQVIENAVETCRPLIEKNRQQLEVTLPAKPLVLDADLTRLSQVFANLLNNASKYSEADGRIRLMAEERGNELIVSVVDSGVGIPTEQLTKVFEMFAQGQSDHRGSGGGLGIGLSLVKRLVELHSGRVTVKSDGPGQGSEFLVHLPLAGGHSLSSSQEHAASAAPVAHLRVLVVDDSEDAALTLATLLELSGHDLHVAHSGEQALVVAEAARPNVVVLDLGLPQLSGYEVCQQIRQQEWGRQMTVIALTGWGQEKDRQRTREAGFDYHLVKPADPGALLQLLDRIGSAVH